LINKRTNEERYAPIRQWVFPPENGGPVYAPRQKGGLEFCQNSGITRKWVIAPGGCTYLGGTGQTKFHIITPYPINIDFWLYVKKSYVLSK